MGNELGGRFVPRIKCTHEEGSITMLRAGISGVCTVALALAFWVAAPVYAQSSGSNNGMSSKSSQQSNSKNAQSQNQAKQNANRHVRQFVPGRLQAVACERQRQ